MSTILSYTYVDNSNIFIEGQRISAVKKGLARSITEAMDQQIIDRDWQLNYGKLHQLICGEKSTIGGAKLWGSPPPGDMFWQMVERKGFKPTIFPKGVGGGEKKVDVAIAHQMTKDAYTLIDKKHSEITLVSGDKDFCPVVEDLVKEGFRVVVAFWDHAARELREQASEFVSLNAWHSHLSL